MAKNSLFDDLMQRLEKRTARVCIIGLGYVGLPLADTFAGKGFPVIGFDVDPNKVQMLKAGKSYIGHIPSERIAKLMAGGKFAATTDPARLGGGGAIVICVPTPLTEYREPDLS